MKNLISIYKVNIEAGPNEECIGEHYSTISPGDNLFECLLQISINNPTLHMTGKRVKDIPKISNDVSEFELFVREKIPQFSDYKNAFKRYVFSHTDYRYYYIDAEEYKVHAEPIGVYSLPEGAKYVYNADLCLDEIITPNGFVSAIFERDGKLWIGDVFSEDLPLRYERKLEHVEPLIIPKPYTRKQVCTDLYRPDEKHAEMEEESR